MMREALLAEATDLLQTESFGRVSFQQLADRVGIKKGSVYYHFPSKDELAVAILEQVVERLDAYLDRYADENAQIQLARYIEIFSRHMKPVERLCPGASFVTTFPQESAEIRFAVKRLYRTHTDRLCRILERGIAEQSFDLQASSTRETARTILSLMQGALLVARVEGSADVLSEVGSAIDRLVTVRGRSDR